MKSKLLNTEINYSVYLPNGFENSTAEYPVIYLSYTNFYVNECDFGLGDATDITQIEIRWPSGFVDNYTNLSTNITIKVREGLDFEILDIHVGSTQHMDHQN